MTFLAVPTVAAGRRGRRWASAPGGTVQGAAFGGENMTLANTLATPLSAHLHHKYLWQFEILSSREIDVDGQITDGWIQQRATGQHDASRFVLLAATAKPDYY